MKSRTLLTTISLVLVSLLLGCLNDENREEKSFQHWDTDTNALISQATNVYVDLFHPKPRAVFQRDRNNTGTIPIGGLIISPHTSIKVSARYTHDSDSLQDGPWTPMNTIKNTFNGELIAPAGGWYTVEMQILDERQDILLETQVNKIGIGEVFITSGQSNSANFGQFPTSPVNDTVSSWNDQTNKWQHATDPQPIVDNGWGGHLGSPWPTLGDSLTEKLGVPIGFISCGEGSTRAKDWLPGKNLFERLPIAMAAAGNNVRAVLWHQGETDAFEQSHQGDYATVLETIISQMRYDAGWNVPWGIAIATYNPLTGKMDQSSIRNSQRLVIDETDYVFQGPNTDLLGPEFRFDGIHFSGLGLELHAKGWHESILKHLFNYN